MSIKVGIFFGGPSREREISFAGGRTVYDNLDKALFEPVPIFVDSFRRWHLLDWEYLYRGSIRDFFPPVELAPKSAHGFQVYQESLGPRDEIAIEKMGSHVGRRIRREELPELIDIAFLALHGEYGEDGQLQKELEYAGVPYTGSGVRASEIGMDKALQKEMMAELGFASPPIRVLGRDVNIAAEFDESVREIGWPMVIRPARQGSSIGVAILRESDGLEGFEAAVDAAFFREQLLLDDYRSLSREARLEYVRTLSDLRDGLAFPLDVQRGDHRLTIYTPDDLFDYLEAALDKKDNPLLRFEAHQGEERVIVEGFIDGKEFSTIVLRTPDGGAVALPPTEIVKHGKDLFDYRSKYLPGLSRKVTPIDLPADRIDAIRGECERLFTELGFETYARIDGFHTPGGGIFLNDPNTTSGMLPSSFFFHQAAEIGLNPSQFLTYIIHASLREREGGDAGALLTDLDRRLDRLRERSAERERIAVLLGGTSFERHISVESGRNVYEKLSSSADYQPVPLFLTAPRSGGEVLYHLPINLLLKDNADDIRDQVTGKYVPHPAIEDIRRACAEITARFADPDFVFEPYPVKWNELPGMVDGVFIALHGRPGEDGQVQTKLEELGLYYNGSRPASAAVTIDKHATLEALRDAGLPVTDQWLATETAYAADPDAFLSTVEKKFKYPFIAKPVDDGCSSAVLLLHDREELTAYCDQTFVGDSDDNRDVLGLGKTDEWPVGKQTILFERRITAEGAEKFLEITGGLLTPATGELRSPVVMQVFEPSEALAGKGILSLEEKFLAGQGQNLTPARLATKDHDYDYVADLVKSDLERAARVLGVEGYCRIDAFVRIFKDGKVETVVIEVNSLPGMTPATAIFHQAALAGYKPYEFIREILKFGKARRAVRASLPPAIVDYPEETEPVQDLRFSGRPDAPVAKESFAPASAPTVTAAEHGSRLPGPWWKRAIAFVFSAPFLKNLIAAALFLGLLFLLLRGFLGWYTNHGEDMVLPTFTDLNIEEARRIAGEQGVVLDVTEGAFDPDREAGTVVLQQPVPGSRVKENRTVYLTILSNEAPMIPLPSLVGNYDYDQYVQKLRAKNIRYRVRDRVLDTKQEENTILHFFYDDRKITDQDVRAGVSVPQGSTLDFVVTIKDDGNRTIPTSYRCKRFGTVEFRLDANSLTVER